MDSTATPASHLSIDAPQEARAVFRSGHYIRQTAAIAPDNFEGNVCVLPKQFALDGDPR
jgi:uncharacterized protein YcsI (UPF0317 family)